MYVANRTTATDGRGRCGQRRQQKPWPKARFSNTCVRSPHCKQPVSSTIRTGQVNHRRTCGNYFRVREGRPCAKQYDYVCPACNGHVASNVATGQINHRTVCGNQFSVQDGVVKEKGIVYRCPFCKGNARSDVRTGQID